MNKIYLGKEFEEMIYAKYHEMKSSNLNEDLINLPLFGKLKIFINTKPEYCLFNLKFATSYFENDNIYIGGNK